MVKISSLHVFALLFSAAYATQNLDHFDGIYNRICSEENAIKTDITNIKSGPFSFELFTLTYLSPIHCEENIRHACAHLHCGTKQFADKLYQWLENNKRLPTENYWSQDKKFMYFTLMCNSDDNLPGWQEKKIFWLKLCDPYWTTNTFKTEQAKTSMKKQIAKELDKWYNPSLKMAYLGLKYQENLRRDKKFDCKICFKK